MDCTDENNLTDDEATAIYSAGYNAHADTRCPYGILTYAYVLWTAGHRKCSDIDSLNQYMNEGYGAWTTFAACPYPSGTLAYLFWQAGWNRGRSETLRRNAPTQAVNVRSNSNRMIDADVPLNRRELAQIIAALRLIDKPDTPTNMNRAGALITKLQTRLTRLEGLEQRRGITPEAILRKIKPPEPAQPPQRRIRHRGRDE